MVGAPVVIRMETARATNPTPTAQEIAEHMPLVQRIVAHFMRRLPRSVQREDLISAGTLGLFHALRSSAHTCPEMFASYARIRIRGSIVDELRRHDWSPRRRKETPPAGNESASNVTPINAANAPDAAQARPRVTVVAFDDLWAGAASGFAEDRASPLESILERREHEALHTAVATLPEREREIVRMRYFQGMPSKAIANIMGLSEARISQLHARAMTQLRDVLGDTETAEEVKLAA
ncbi:MAG: polymerase sigma factor for flagellar operon [Labilithrix sp.]|nr:polymerase sigma factor for flagellar operon [Labilithrix sp.]